MSNYLWLLTIKLSNGSLATADAKGYAPDPGDLVELEDGTIATVITHSIFTNDEHYQTAIAIAEPLKVVRWYERKPVREDRNDAHS